MPQKYRQIELNNGNLTPSLTNPYDQHAKRAGDKTVAPGEGNAMQTSRHESLKALVRTVIPDSRNPQQNTPQIPTSAIRNATNSREIGIRWERGMNVPELNDKAWQALGLVKDARDLAEKWERNIWDFAVELSEFVDLGVGRNVLRILICERLIEHRSKESGKQDLALSDSSSFVLTNEGRKVLQQHRHSTRNSPLIADSQLNGFPPGRAPEDEGRNRREQPHWDENLRELKIGETVVKRFKWPAVNQEKVIKAFHEEGWPTKIDDPLPPSKDVCPKRRLHDTIKCLNRKQINKAIKFRGDGTGQGVMIEIIPENMPDSNK